MSVKLSLGALAALQLTAGLLLQLSIIRIVGLGGVTDAFIAAQSIPLVIFAILSVSLSSVWQPRFSVLQNNPAKWREAQGVAQGQTLILISFLTLPLAVFAKTWIALIFPGFDEQQILLTAEMTLPLLAGAAFNVTSSIIITALRARDLFVRGEVASLAGTLSSLVAINLMVPEIGIESAPWIVFARALAVYAAVYFLAQRPRILLKHAWQSRAEWKGLEPLLAGSALYKTSPLVDRYWSSQTTAGGVTVFNLAQTAMGALATVIERSVCVPIVPQFARLAESHKFEEIKKTYRNCLLQITALTALLACVLIALYPIWEFLLEAVLHVPKEKASEVWQVCMALLGYLHVAASGTIPVSVFYAMGDTLTPVRIGVTGFIIGVIIKSIGFLTLGLPGLAVATSIYYVGNMIVMCILLEKKIAHRLL